jgi:hypothetical protein
VALAFGAPLVFVYVMSRLPPAKAKEYLSAELGALLGAVLAVPLAALVFFIGLRVFRFESLEDLDRSIKMGLAGGVVTLFSGAQLDAGLPCGGLVIPNQRRPLACSSSCYS